jgi:hypothetical protein
MPIKEIREFDFMCLTPFSVVRKGLVVLNPEAAGKLRSLARICIGVSGLLVVAALGRFTARKNKLLAGPAAVFAARGPRSKLLMVGNAPWHEPVYQTGIKNILSLLSPRYVKGCKVTLLFAFPRAMG